MSTRWGIGGRCPPGSLVIGRVMGCSFVVVSVRALRGPQRKRILEKHRRQPSVHYLSMSVVLPVSSCAIPRPPVPASRRPRRKNFLGFFGSAAVAGPPATLCAITRASAANLPGQARGGLGGVARPPPALAVLSGDGPPRAVPRGRRHG